MNHRRLRKKLIIAFFIICIYILGQNIPLSYVRVNSVSFDTDQTFTEMLQAVNGSGRQGISIFALGIMPYMAASILMMLKNLGKTKKKQVPLISPDLQVKLLALVICAVSAYIRTMDYGYTELIFNSYLLTRLFTMLVLVTGTFVIMWLAEMNNADGLGGMSVIILVNITKTIVRNLLSVKKGFETGVYDPAEDTVKVVILLLIGLISMIFIMIFDEAEIRIPVQKVMIYSEMADDNYMAIKLAPIGIQPMMYVMAFYMLPNLLFTILAFIFPDVIILQMIANSLQMNTVPGVFIFLLIFFLLSLALATVQISPDDISEDMVKSGDCVVGLRPGEETRRYLNKIVMGLSVVSSLILGFLVVLPMFLRIFWGLPQELAMVPMSLMFMGGILRRVFQQIKVLAMLDSYQEVL